MSHRQIKQKSGQKEQGLTLVEMMVALTIGMVLLGGVITILSASQQTYRVNEALARVQENARYAFQLLARDIRMAGYMGCVGDGVEVFNALNDNSDFLWRLHQPLEGFEATSAAAWTPSLPSPAGMIPSALGGCDIIVVRGVDGGDARVLSHPSSMPPGSADLTVTTSSGLSNDDIVLVTDCLAAAIFQITNISTSAGQSKIEHDIDIGTPGNSAAALGNEYTGGEIVRVTTRAYFIRTNPRGIPALYWRRGTGAAEELIEGVEDMQIQYGEDLDGDRSADVYRTADQIADWEAVVSVRINLLVQSVEDGITSQPQTYTFNGTTVTPTDRRLRQAFFTVISLRNRAP